MIDIPQRGDKRWWRTRMFEKQHTVWYYTRPHVFQNFQAAMKFKQIFSLRIDIVYGEENEESCVSPYQASVQYFAFCQSELLRLGWHTH